MHRPALQLTPVCSIDENRRPKKKAEVRYRRKPAREHNWKNLIEEAAVRERRNALSRRPVLRNSESAETTVGLVFQC